MIQLRRLLQGQSDPSAGERRVMPRGHTPFDLDFTDLAALSPPYESLGACADGLKNASQVGDLGGGLRAPL